VPLNEPARGGKMMSFGIADRYPVDVEDEQHRGRAENARSSTRGDLFSPILRR